MKRVCIKALPRTLILHLKRFEFDFDYMKKVKVRFFRHCKTVPGFGSRISGNDFGHRVSGFGFRRGTGWRLFNVLPRTRILHLKRFESNFDHVKKVQVIPICKPPSLTPNFVFCITLRLESLNPSVYEP